METITTEMDISKIQHLDFEFEIVPDGFDIITKEDGGEPERTMTAVISSANVDRVGDRVMPAAFKNLHRDKDKIPLLWSHDRSSMPIGKSMWIKNDHKNQTVVGRFVFRNNPQSKDVWDMINEGFITKVSVGFNVLGSEGFEQNDFNGYDITKAELLEVSLVNIPANRDAVIQGVKGMMDAGHEFCDSTLKEFGLLEVIDDAEEEIVEEVSKDVEKELTVFECITKIEELVENIKLLTTSSHLSDEESGEVTATCHGDDSTEMELSLDEESDSATAACSGDEQEIIEIVED